MTVMVVGDVILDEYIWGEVRRISPEAPVPVVELRKQSYVPGGAANAACNVAGLGGNAILCGVIGADAAAANLIQSLRQCNVQTSGLIVEAERPTTSKTRIVAHNQQIVRVDHEKRNALSLQAESAMLAWLERSIHEADACILSDYAKGVASPRLCQSLISLARDHQKPIVVDPKGTDYSKYRGATLIKPNVHEAERVLNREIVGDGELEQAGDQLLSHLPGTAVLITRGNHGMSLFRPGVKVAHFPSMAREVFDVTGAGDTVISSLALGLAAKLTVDQSAVIANLAAGIAVSRIGTTAVNQDELLQAASSIS